MQKEDEEITHKKMVNSDQKGKSKGLGRSSEGNVKTPLTESLDLGNSV